MQIALYIQSQYIPTMQLASFSTSVVLRVQHRVSSLVYFDRNNGATADEYHIGIRRAIAEVSLCTEVLIWTSDVEG